MSNNTILRNVILSFIGFAIIILSGSFVMNSVLSNNDINIDHELNTTAFSSFETSLSEFQGNLSEEIEEPPRSSVQEITDFFTKSVNIATSFLAVPSIANAMATYIFSMPGFNQIPASIVALIIGFIIILIAMTVISAWRGSQT